LLTSSPTKRANKKGEYVTFNRTQTAPQITECFDHIALFCTPKIPVVFFLPHKPEVLFSINKWGWPETYIYTVYDHISDDFPAKNAVHTASIGFWPT
jgi:hypothetical protein